MPEPLAIYSAVNISYGLAKELYGYVESWVKAGAEAKAYKIRFAATQAQLEAFREFFHANEKHIAAKSADSIRAATDELNISLKATKAKIEKYDPNTWRRVQWPWIGKSLDKAEAALAGWVQRLATTFVFLPESLKEKIAEKFISAEYAAMMFPLVGLKEHIAMKKKQDELQKLDAEALLKTIKAEPADDEVKKTFYWKDSIMIDIDDLRNEASLKDAKVEVAKLAAVLSGASAKKTNIPKAHCWYQQKDGECGIAYTLPSAVQFFPDYPSKIPTLKDMVQRTAKHSLNDRLNLAIEIASAVSYIHGLEWVHKSIHSENILLLYESDSVMPPSGLGRANVVGFSIARRSLGRSMNKSENKIDWKRQIYSHPKRQLINLVEEAEQFYGAAAVTTGNGNDANNGATGDGGNNTLLSPSRAVQNDGHANADMPRLEFYKYKHDIYSLGVVLLELGCWMDLCRAEVLKTKQPDERRSWLLELAGAEGKLIQTMGQRYADVVRACLDVDNSKCDIEQVLTDLYEIRF